MKIYVETSLENFEAWSGAVDTLDRIIAEGKCDELEAILEEQYPDGMSDTELNDLLWFEEETIFEWLGIRTESEILEELEELNNELEELEIAFEEEAEKLEPDEKDALWKNDYAFDYEQIEEKIAELNEELENI